jgi:glycosyltransferase involved in cell wall biosynthesis
MKIFYWSPFLSNIATIDAVLNSIKSLNSYDKNNNFDPSLIDAVGEWAQKKSKTQEIQIKKLYKKEIYQLLPKGSFLRSRFSQTIIFLLSFFRLRKLIIKESPEYLIAHLIVSLPLLLFTTFNFKTKLILRISGTPKLNFIRKFFWRLFSKKIYKITCPTHSTYNRLKELKIFPEEKLNILYDPIISVREINKKKLEKLDNKLRKQEFILGIGRLTKQKNFKLLINAFAEISTKLPKLELIIIGEGEEKNKLQRLISELGLDNKVHLVGYKNNVFNYLYNAKCFISSSLYEDPGFVLIEAGFLNKIVFAADSKTGPSEILNFSKRGFLYKNNNYKDLVRIFFNFNELDPLELKNKKIYFKKYSKNFTFFSHYKFLKKILS